MLKLDQFIKTIPKAELHLHIEGTLEPELMFSLAKKNKINLKFKSIEDVKAAYNFSNLQDFLDIYYQGAQVLITEQDFYNLAFTYFERVKQDNVMHAEIFFDPQTHTERGIKFETFMSGFIRAQKDAKEKLNISSHLIMCFLRHLDEKSALETLELSSPYKENIKAVGLDSSELNNPPSKFVNVFQKAKEMGFLTVAHAGEEGPSEYVWEALKILNVSRVDHGNRSLEDQKLVKELVARKMPLTVCPLSNLKLKVVKDLKDHPLKKMLDLQLFVTVNSDDPAYFGGYVNDNFLAIQKSLNLEKNHIIKLAQNSFQASFLSEAEKKSYLDNINQYINSQ